MTIRELRRKLLQYNPDLQVVMEDVEQHELVSADLRVRIKTTVEYRRHKTIEEDDIFVLISKGG